MVSKSQLAIEYAYLYQRLHPQNHVFWISAASTSSFLRAHRGIARDLKLPGFDDPQIDQAKLVLQWLKDDENQWLMILDNSDDTHLFFPGTESGDATPSKDSLKEDSSKPLIEYLPEKLNAQQSILVTTRNRLLGTDLAHGEASIEVRPFSVQEGEELLRKKLSSDILRSAGETWGRLLDVLGFIPLAITQAAAFMNRNRVTTSEYLSALEKDKSNLIEHLNQELQDPRRPPGAPNSVFRTWKISFDYISDHEPHAALLLSLAAVLDHQSIPDIILRQLVHTDLNFSMAIGTLDGFSLITREIGSKSIALHPLIHACVQHWVRQKGEKARYGTRGLAIVLDVLPVYDERNRHTYRDVVPHARALLKSNCFFQDNLVSRSKADVLLNCSRWHIIDGDFHLTHSCASEAFDILRKLDEEFSLLGLRAVWLQAQSLSFIGRHHAAEEVYRHALKISEQLPAGENLATLKILLSLAGSIIDQGRLEAAEEMYRCALKSFEDLPGDNHTGIVACMSNLAILFSKQGKDAAAEAMCRRAMERCRDCSDSEELSDMYQFEHISTCLLHLGMYDVAEELQRRIIRSYAEHPVANKRGLARMTLQLSQSLLG